MPLQSLKIDTVWKKLALIGAGAVLLVGAWSSSKWGMASSAAIRTDDPNVALFLTELAPSDPQTHYTAAVLLQKSFDENDMRRALEELEIAARLAPENYVYWLELGQARERAGDRVGAEAALRRALELAPNYARVHWALGNTLLRDDRIEEAFIEIRKAVESDPTSFANSAATTAWVFLDQDIDRIRRLADGIPGFEAALVLVLVREKRFDEAVDIWNRLASEERKGALREHGKALVDGLLGEKRIRSALAVFNDLSIEGTAVQIGRVSNGGFESPVRPAAPYPFEWQIASGIHPQIVLTNGVKHSGNNALLMVFNSSEGKDFRTVSQLIAVEPDTPYELEVWYRAEVETAAVLRWEVAGVDGRQLAISDPVSNQSQWTALRVGFKSPPAKDGITIRLIRDNCGVICPSVGSVWFDDISLRSAEAR